MRVVITGGPGGGKTALLQELERRGFVTVEDTPRAIIRSRRAAALSARPSPLEFGEQWLRRDIELYERNAGEKPTFFERGVLDALAMVADAAPERETELRARARDYPYHPVVFVLPPWEEIYATDDERDHSFAHAVRVSESIVTWYQSCGYEVAPVPRLTVAGRCDHVLSALGRLPARVSRPFSVRRARTTDAEAAVDVVRRSIVELCTADHRGDAETLARWLANKTAQNFATWFESDENHCVVVEAERRVLGVGALKRSGEVSLLYLAPDAKGRGMGKAVHAALEEQARVWGLRELTLDSTERACPFYERLGYRSAGGAGTRFDVMRVYPYVKTLW